VHRVLGVTDRFEKDVIQPSPNKSEADSRGMQEVIAEGGSHSERVGSYSGYANSNQAGCPISPPPLQGTTGSKDKRPMPPPLIRVNGGIECSLQERSPVVDPPSQSGVWLPDPTPIPSSRHRIRCIEYRLGSPLWTTQDRRSVGTAREKPAYQWQGDAGSISGSADFCEGSERDPCQTEGRQHNNSMLHQSDGGHTFPTNDASYSQIVELEPGKEDSALSRTSAGQAEPDSRPGIQNAGRQLRVEAVTSRVQANKEADGRLSDRSLCITPDNSTGYVYELEARSGSSGHRCTGSTMELHKGLCLSSIRPDWKVSEEGTQRESSRTGTDHTSMANSAVVSNAGVNGNKETHTDPSSTRPAEESQGRKSPPNQTRVTESSRVVSLRRSLTEEGISEEALCHLGEATQKQRTHQVGKDGNDGVWSVGMSRFAHH